MALSRKQRVLLITLGLVISVILPATVVFGEGLIAGFYATQSSVHLNATSGPEVVTSKDYNLQSGNPFTDKSVNLSTESNGWLNVSTSDPDSSSMVLTVDEINGTWTNVSSATVTSGNVTLQPSDKNFTRIGGGITAFKFKEAKVDGGDSDAIYEASSSGTIVFETNGTDGTQYGLVDVSNNEGLDVATAQPDGTIAFTDVPSTTSPTEVRIEELGTLTIRNETSPHSKVTGCTVTVKFFQPEEDSPTIEERTTNNAEVDLTGLPVDETFVVDVKCTGYYNRSIIIDDLSQQESVFLLSKDRNASEIEFIVDDLTGEFDEDTQLTVQKAINRSKYGGSPSGFQWTNVAGDEVGAVDTFVVDLENGDRYRIRVDNTEDDVRILGTYRVAGATRINLQIRDLTLTLAQGDTWDYAANFTDDGGGGKEVNFQFNDPEDKTTDLRVIIWEQGDASNEIFNQSFPGPHGALSVTQPLTAAQANKTWVVEFSATHSDAGDIGASVVVGGSNLSPGIPIEDKWKFRAGFGLILIVGLLTAGGVNATLGAISMALVGGLLWLAGWLPGEIGGGVVVLALFLAGAFTFSTRSGGDIQ